MSKITYIQQDGIVREGNADGGSAMELALSIGVRGIEGQCGGVMSCGTCHVRVADDWLSRVGAASADEIDILEFEEGFSDHSRLSCQIPVGSQADGLVVTVVRG